MSAYDVIVIGGGLAGLTSAANLAQAGARVLVCEQGQRVGGLFNSFQMDGFQFDGGIKAVENSAVMMPMLAQLGLLERIAFNPSPISLIIQGQVHPMRNFSDVENYLMHLGSYFPEEITGLEAVVGATQTVFDFLDAILSIPIPFFDLPGGNEQQVRKNWMKANRGIIKQLPQVLSLFKAELRSYLSRYIHHPNLINLLSALFPEGTSTFFGLGYFRMFLDYYYPQGGIRIIPDVLSAAILESQGEIRLGARVQKVLAEGGQACGVELATGEKLLAGYVIAACDLRGALLGMVPDFELPAKFTQALEQAQVSHSVFNLFLGLDLSPGELGLGSDHHLFYFPDLEGVSKDDRVHDPDYFLHVPQEISIPCLQDESLAPKGKTGLNLSAMTTWEYGGGWMREKGDYDAFKEECARKMITSIEKYIPGLSDHIVCYRIGTPRTVQEQTSNTQGAIMGWSYERKQAFSRKMSLNMRKSVQTPIPRLLSAGHWTFSPGGSPVAVLTGKLAADNILNQIKQS